MAFLRLICVMKKYFALSICCFFAFTGRAQAQEPTKTENALEKVFTTLMLEAPQIHGDTLSLLKRGAWEALAYIEPNLTNTINDLHQAVPDYYHFTKDTAIVKLINPKNTNEYSIEALVPYTVNQNAEIQLIKQGVPTQKWQILYLDNNYMALIMGTLRVFFTHTPLQE